MVEGPSVDRHHLVPKSGEGGREVAHLHRVCHRKLHTLWTEAELARLWHDPAVIREHPEVRRFAAWLANKPAEFWAPTDPPGGRRRRG